MSDEVKIGRGPAKPAGPKTVCCGDPTDLDGGAICTCSHGLGVARLERALRAKVAAEIRAACECATSDDQAIVRSCEYDRAARIAEGNGDEPG